MSTAATPSTWTWLGTTTAWADSANWSLTGGSGNSNNYPAAGDTELLNGGTVSALVITGAQLSDNTIDLSGGAVVDFASGSTLDAASAVNATAGTVDVSGRFTLLGSLGVVGSTGTLTVAIDGTLVSNGTANDIGINDGQAGSLGNGTLVVTGGTVEAEGIHINDGVAIISTALDSSDEISVTGGSAEVNLTTAGAPVLQFVASTVPSTIKFDDPTSYNDGFIQGFASGDTIDIGANIIGTIIYSGDLGGYADLTVENASGSTLLSAMFSGGDEATLQAGTFTVGSSGGTAGSFQVTQGSGDTLIGESSSSTPPSSSVPNDFNGDGTSDFLVTDSSGDIVSWMVQSGTLSGSPTYFATATDGWSYLATGDFYGNGSTDILVTDSTGDLVDWQSQNGTLSGSPTYIGTATDGWHYVATGDFTGNGTDDILVGDSSGDLAYWPITAGTLSGSPTYIGTATSGWSFLATADLHGSGTDDILLQNSAGSIVDWYMQNGAISGSPTYVGTATDGWSFLATGDFTGNGTDDLLLQDSSGDLAYWPISDGTLSGSPTDIGTLNNGWSFLSTGNYYGNSTSDIAVQNTTSGAVAVWKISDGALSGSPSYVASAIDGWHPIAGT